ncbi:EAL domain-containing response regulator [Pseudomonas capsici]|uniref:EAL domain-containing response regulator n=1 Tax=Pseudomonas capsici TaxID=2810614 RepID=UPI0021F23427|nr:EAL domain-containing response regulator [Pseudomonas capsici]MCV4341159.1 EAL domain-containing response regulator [Pseudomonas capsici]
MRDLKVLILEDNPFQLMALHQMLNANQVFDVLTADSVEAARQSLLNRGRVDIAICDLQMEGDDGLELIGHLARSGQALALIVLSSASQPVLDGVVRLARSQGLEVLGGLQKPASAARLHDLLQAYDRSTSIAAQGVSKPRPRHVLCAGQLFGMSVVPGHLDPLSLAEQWVAHFQPKVSVDGDVLGVEALVRWQHPLHGLLAPGSFMSAIESEGLVVPLTWRVLELALQLSADVRFRQGEALPVAVNIAPQVLEQADFATRVMALLARYELPANILTLEILENDALDPQAWQLEALLRLRMQGCKLSIDDFGMGASNIQRLLQLPFCELKIPTEFVRGIAEDPRKSAVVAGAMFMARRLSMDVVVEGVETIDDFHSLLVLETPAIQGYFISRPLCAADLLVWLAERKRSNPQVVSRKTAGQDNPCSCR